jgi:hypothetical protein
VVIGTKSTPWLAIGDYAHVRINVNTINGLQLTVYFCWLSVINLSMLTVR